MKLDIWGEIRSYSYYSRGELPRGKEYSQHFFEPGFLLVLVGHTLWGDKHTFPFMGSFPLPLDVTLATVLGDYRDTMSCRFAAEALKTAASLIPPQMTLRFLSLLSNSNR